MTLEKIQHLIDKGLHQDALDYIENKPISDEIELDLMRIKVYIESGNYLEANKRIKILSEDNLDEIQTIRKKLLLCWVDLNLGNALNKNNAVGSPQKYRVNVDFDSDVTSYQDGADLGSAAAPAFITGDNTGWKRSIKIFKFSFTFLCYWYGDDPGIERIRGYKDSNDY